MNTIALKTAAVAATAAFIITLVGCSPIAHPPALTVAVTATSAEPAPETASIEHLLIGHADAAYFPKDGTITVVTPTAIDTIDLTPMRGNNVENAETKRAEKITANLADLDDTLRTAASTSDGLDVIGVLDKALTATAHGGTVVLISSGLSTVDPANLTQAGDWARHPDEFVAATDPATLPDAVGRNIIFAGIGSPYPAGGQATPGPGTRKALETILLGLCHKMNAVSCTILTGLAGSEAPASLNVVPVIDFGDIITACVGEITLDANVLFGGDSAYLLPTADAALTPIADGLKQCPTGLTINAAGYTADVDCDNDPNDAADLAIARAQSVLTRMRTLGAPAATIGTATNGGHLINNCPNGAYDESLAQNNRAVTLTAG